MSKRAQKGAIVPRRFAIREWLSSRFGHDRDPLIERLKSVPDAGTPLTTDERSAIDSARCEIKSGQYVRGEEIFNN